MSSITSTIYHVGGREGVHPTWKNFPTKVHYVGFEPETDAFTHLKSKVSRQDNITYNVEPVALSDTPGITTFNVYNKPDLSSFLQAQPEETHRYKHSGLQLAKEIEVACDTLDNVCNKRNEQPDFLILDTQGTELNILRGGQNILEDVLGIRCEVEFLEFYKNQPLFFTVCAFLHEHGFQIITFEKTGSGKTGISTDAGPFSKSIDDARLAWADAIFIKDLNQVMTDEIKIIKTVFFAINNKIGSIGMDLLWRLIEGKRLKLMLGKLAENDKKNIRKKTLEYLKEVEKSNWQTNKFYQKISHEKSIQLKMAMNEI